MGAKPLPCALSTCSWAVPGPGGGQRGGFLVEALSQRKLRGTWD